MNTPNEHLAEIESTSFYKLASQAVYGVCLNLKDQVVATHREFGILRRCADILASNPDQELHILSPGNMVRTRYIVKTLMHLGVSCGRINVNLVHYNRQTPNGIWLLVTENDEELAA